MKISSKMYAGQTAVVKNVEVGFKKDGEVSGIVYVIGASAYLKEPLPLEQEHVDDMIRRQGEFDVYDDAGNRITVGGFVPVSPENRVLASQEDGDWKNYGVGVPVTSVDNEAMLRDYGFTVQTWDESVKNSGVVRNRPAELRAAKAAASGETPAAETRPEEALAESETPGAIPEGEGDGTAPVPDGIVTQDAPSKPESGGDPEVAAETAVAENSGQLEQQVTIDPAFAGAPIAHGVEAPTEEAATELSARELRAQENRDRRRN